MPTALARLLTLVAALVSLTSVVAETITAAGSDTLVSLGQKCAAAYQAKHPETKILVAGGGEAAAFEALAEHKINLATVSRSIRFRETDACKKVFGQRPTEFKLGVNGAVVYVNADNPLKVLNYDELAAVFTGKTRNWKNLGGPDLPITVYGVDTNSAAGELFVVEVMMRQPLTNDLQIIPGPELLKAIAQDKHAIGFGSLASLDGTRALQIKRAVSSTPVEPTPDAIANRFFPISRFIYCYLDPAANQGDLKSYLLWLHSDEGQRLVSESGYFPLPAKWRTNP
jgi:phosphate transport system substrate-binding protein